MLTEHKKGEHWQNQYLPLVYPGGGRASHRYKRPWHPYEKTPVDMAGGKNTYMWKRIINFMLTTLIIRCE
jgi:hypothetical protein